MKMKLGLSSIHNPSALVGLGVCLVVFILYVVTLSPTIYYGDSAEFITAASEYGIPHPPGFPLYTLIITLFGFLPGDNLAVKVNLVSAFAGTVTILLVYFICLKLTQNIGVAAVTALLLAFTAHFWLYSLVAEAFMLNNLLFALLIFLALKFWQHPDTKHLYLLCFFFGLSLTPHQINLFFAPALLYLIWYKRESIPNAKTLAACLGLFLVGLAPYLYLPLAGRTDTYYTWGDLTSVPGIFRHILRMDYGAFGAHENPDPKPPGTLTPYTYYLSFLLTQFTVLGGVLSSFGLYKLWKKHRQLSHFFLITFFFTGVFFIYLSGNPVQAMTHKGIIERFYFPSITIIAILIGVGLAAVISSIKKHPALNQKTIRTLVSVFFLLLPVGLIAKNYSHTNQRSNHLYYHYGLNLLDTLPPDSLLLVTGDAALMSTEYLTLVEHKRPDIKIVNFTLLPADWYRALINRRYPNLNLPEIDPAQTALERAQLICRRTLDDQPVYLDTWTEGLNPIENQDCTFTRQGLLVRLSPPGTQVNVEELTQTNDFLWQNYRDTGRLTSLRPADSRTRELMYYYSHALGELGIAYQQAGRLDLAQETYLQANQISPDNGLTRSLLASILIEQGHFDQAIELEKEAVTVQPTSISSYLNLGLIYAQVKQQPDQAIHYLRKYLDVLPHKPQYNKQRQEITQLINQL